MRTAVQLEELREAEARGAGADHEDRAAGFGRDAVEAVDGAGCRFEDGCLGPGKLREGEELGGGEDAVFREAAVHYAGRVSQPASTEISVRSQNLQ